MLITITMGKPDRRKSKGMVREMTRKKALEILLGEKNIYVLSARSSGKEEYVKAIKTIKKDLEVLDIFKKLLASQYAGIDINTSKITSEEYLKIVEWLENEEK